MQAQTHMEPYKRTLNRLHRPTLTYGCSRDEANCFTNDILTAYRAHKSRAKRRSIDWEFNLLTWWDAWSKSGKWELRGPTGESYCMARFGDVGPYSPSNVYICTKSQNAKDWWALGLPRGPYTYKSRTR